MVEFVYALVAAAGDANRHGGEDGFGAGDLLVGRSAADQLAGGSGRD
jgi:hypothetical protein